MVRKASAKDMQRLLKAGATSLVAGALITSSVSVAFAAPENITQNQDAKNGADATLGVNTQNKSVDPKTESEQNLAIAKEKASQAAKDLATKEKVAQEAEKVAKDAAERAQEAEKVAEKTKNDALVALAKAKEDARKKAEIAAAEVQALKNKLATAKNEKVAAEAKVAVAEKEKQAAQEALNANPAPDSTQLEAAKAKVVAAQKAKQDAVEAQNKATAEVKDLQAKLQKATEAAETANTALQQARQAKEQAEKLVGTRQNEVDTLTAKVNELENDASDALREAKKALNTANKQLAEAKTTEKEAQEKLVSAQQKVQDADNALKAAQKAVETGENLLKGLQTEKENALKAYESAINAVTVAESKEKEVAAKNEVAENRFRKATEAFKEAETAKNTADQKVAAAQERFNKAKAALENDNSRAEAQAKWDRGAEAFYEEMGSTEAANVLKQPKGVHTGVNPQNITEKDSRTLENMKHAIDQIPVINAKRQSDRGIDGRQLSMLKVTDYAMAVAQANANYSASNFNHSRVYTDYYENLAWAASSRDMGKGTASSALKGWWDDEKQVFDELRAKGYTTRTKMDEYIKTHQDEFKSRNVSSVGHYTNLVDDLMYGEFKGDDNKVIGYAVRPATVFDTNRMPYQNVQSMVLSTEEKGDSYTAEEYKQRFLEYYNDLLEKKTNGDPQIKREFEEAQKDLREAQAEQALAKTTFDTRQQEKTAAEEAVKGTRNAFQAATSELQTKEEMQAKALEAKIAAEEAYDAQVATNEKLVREVGTKQSDKESAENNAQEMQKQVTAAENEVKAKESVVQEKQQDLQAIEGGTAIGTARENLAKAQKSLEEAQKNVETETAKVNAAETALQEKNQEKADLAGKLQTATDEETQATEAVVARQNDLTQAQAQLTPLEDQQTKHEAAAANFKEKDSEITRLTAEISRIEAEISGINEKTATAEETNRVAEARAAKIAAIDGETALRDGLDTADADYLAYALPVLFNAYPVAQANAETAQKLATEKQAVLAPLQAAVVAAQQVNNKAKEDLALAQVKYDFYHRSVAPNTGTTDQAGGGANNSGTNGGMAGNSGVANSGNQTNSTAGSSGAAGSSNASGGFGSSGMKQNSHGTKVSDSKLAHSGIDAATLGTLATSIALLGAGALLNVRKGRHKRA